MAAGERPWFYLQDRQQMGPLPELQLRLLVRNGTIEPDWLVWTDGMPRWERADTALPRYLDQNDEWLTTALPLDAPIYFPVSSLKFIVMSVVTLGIYELYWFYRNWNYLKLQGFKVSPFWRAWFGLLFFYDLAARIKSDLSSQVPVNYTSGWLALTYVLVSLSANLPYPIGVISLLTFLPVLPMVSAVNEVNLGRLAPSDMNTRFSAWNIAAIAVFAVLWVIELLLTFWPNLLPS